MIASVLTAPWFYWAIGIAVGLPLALIVLTEWQHTLRRRGSTLLGPVTLLRNFLVPLAALLMAMIGAVQIPAKSTPVRVVGTLAAIALLVLLLSGIRNSLFASAPQNSWRRRVPSIFIDVIRFGLIAIGGGLIFAYIWGANVGGLFTALGIGSIVIGLTLQKSVGQIISGLLMLFEQPFRLGDFIETSTEKGRVIEVNWRAVHIDTGSGIRITPNSVLAGESFLNLSRPAGDRIITVPTVFAVEDRPDQVCAVLDSVASQLPQLRIDASPSSGHLGAMRYSTDIPLRSANDDFAAKTTFLRWLWYAARRAGLHLDEADDGFDDPGELAHAIRTVVAPTLRLTPEQQHDMAQHAAVERYGAGEMLHENGSIPEAVRFIVSGTVLMTADSEDGSRTEVATFEEGSFLGASTLIRHPATGSAFAVDEVTVVRVSRDAIEKVVQRNPVLLQEFGRSIDEHRSAVLRALAESEPDSSVSPS